MDTTSVSPESGRHWTLGDMVGDTTRRDPVGTVREHDDGTTAVKVAMGDDTGKGQHVWCWMRPDFEVRWLHHLDVADWATVPSVAEPRVFFPGDIVPAGVALITKHGDALPARAVPYRITGSPTAAYVELQLPSLEDWQAAVDRARDERGFAGA